MLVGENLAQRAVVGVGHGAVGEDEVVVGEFLVAGLRRLRPAVLVRRVVEDEVQHEADAVLAQFRRQRAQIVHRAEPWVDLAVVADGIAAVVVALRRLEERHQVQIGQPQLLEIGDLGAHALQVAGKEIDVVDAAQHLLGLIPARVALARGVQRLERGGPVQPGLRRLGQDALQVIEEVVAVAVQRRASRRKEIVEMLPPAGGGRSPTLGRRWPRQIPFPDAGSRREGALGFSVQFLRFMHDAEQSSDFCNGNEFREMPHHACR